MSVFEQLKKEIPYAQRSFSEGRLYQIHGFAVMLRRLGEITAAEEEEICAMTIDFIAKVHLLRILRKRAPAESGAGQ